MARYFFNSHHDFATLDTVAREMIDQDAARQQALCEARHAAANEVYGVGTLSLSHRIEVTDASGAVVTTERLAEAVYVRP
jgi:hypothetical protein